MQAHWKRVGRAAAGAGLMLGLAACSSTPPPDVAEAADHHTAIGLHLFREGHPREANERFEYALEAVPGHAQALSGRGLVREQRGDLAGARDDHEAAVRAAPENAALQNNLGRVLCRDGDPERAYEVFSRAAGAPDYDVPEVPWTNAALCALESGHPARARKYAEHALQAASGYPPALAALGELETRDGDPEAGLGWFERYFDAVAEPGSRALYWAGHAEMQQGNRSEALRYWTTLHEQAPYSRYAARLKNDGDHAHDAR